MPVATETRTMRIPAFNYKDIGFPVTTMSRDIEFLGTGKPAYELGPQSITLGYQAALWEIALRAKLGLKTDVPEGVTEAALQYYDVITSQSNKGKGNWNKTAFDYVKDFGTPNNWRSDKGYERVGVIDNPKWVQKNGVWIPKGRPVAVDAPPNGFVALTMDGLYQPTGVAYETASRDESVKRLADFAKHFMDERVARKFGEKHASYSYRRNKGDGYSVVYRHFALDDDGPFYVHALWGADGGSRGLGAFPSRSSGKK